MILGVVLTISNTILDIPKYLSNLILLFWFNMMIYFNIKYRVGYKKVNMGLIKIKVTKIVLFIIIAGIISALNAHIQQPEFQQKIKDRRRLSYQIPEIREGVYNVCEGIFNEVQKAMKKNTTIPNDIKKEMEDKLDSITYKINALRTNEIELIREIHEILECNELWYEAKVNGDKIEMEKQLEVYNQSILKVENFKKFYEK